MRIALINELYSDNLGDNAIADAMTGAIESLGHRVERFDFCFRDAPERDSAQQLITKIQNVQSMSSAKLLIKSVVRFVRPGWPFRILRGMRSYYKALQILDNEFDIVVIGGGQLILSNGIFSVSMLVWSLASKRKKLRAHIIAVGVGSKFDSIDKFFFKVALKCISSVSVRDSESLEFLKSQFDYNGGILIPDSAYFLMAPPRCYVEDRILIAPVEYGVHLRYWAEMRVPKLDYEGYRAFWKQLIIGYLDSDRSVILTATTIKDYLFCEDLMCSLGYSHKKNTRLEKCDDWRQFLRLSNESSEVVSGRMHALILGQVSGAIIRPVILSRKIESFSSGSALCDSRSLRAEFTQTLRIILDS